MVIVETSEMLALPPRYFEDMMPFQYRIDATPAVAAFARYQSRTATLEGPQARAFAERLASGVKLHVRVSGFESNLDLSFAATGARMAIEKVAHWCGDSRLIKRLGRK